jgi:eukaryotic-like serine/threonine-protein kinase
VAPTAELEPPRHVGRYLLYGPIASGGMATVHFGALVGEAGFSRTVAIKRIRADRRSPELLAGLVDEARLVSRVQHPNVVATLDVVSDADELFVVLEYIAGETLARLLRSCEDLEAPIPPRIATTIIAGVLHGLHAAHDAKSARAKPLGIVHRDVSPQNILVGIDGMARVLDFGIAKASERLSSTYQGQVKGKLAYMAPEQLHDQVDRRTDIYATAVVLWEMLAGRRLFWGKLSGDVMQKLLEMEVPPPSRHAADLSPELDRLVLRGLARNPDERFASARHFALALEEVAGIATATQIGSWVQELAGESLSARAEKVAVLERHALAHADGADLTTGNAARPRPTAGPRESTRPASTPPPDEPLTRQIADETELSQENVVAEELSTIAMLRPFSVVAEPPAPAPAEMETAVTTALDTPVARQDEPVSMSAFVPRSPWRSLLLGAAALATVAVLVLWLSNRGDVAPARPVESSAVEEPPAPPPQEPVAHTSEPAPTTTTTEAPPPASQVAASASASAPPPPWASASAKPPPPVHSAFPPVRNCSPPYTIDARGVRRLKPECI